MQGGYPGQGPQMTGQMAQHMAQLQQQQQQQAQQMHNHLNMESMSQHFEHVMTLDPSQTMAQAFEAG